MHSPQVQFFFQRNKKNDSSSCARWLIHLWHDVFTCDMLHFWCDMTRRCIRQRNNFSKMKWLIHMWRGSSSCDMTYALMTCLINVWHDSPERLPQGHFFFFTNDEQNDWSMFDMTYLLVTCLVFLCVTWRIDLSETWLSLCVTWLIDVWDMTQSMCDMTHWCVRHDSLIWVRHDSVIRVT